MGVVKQDMASQVPTWPIFVELTSKLALDRGLSNEVGNSLFRKCTSRGFLVCSSTGLLYI